MERLKLDFTGDREMAKTFKFCCNLVRFAFEEDSFGTSEANEII